jgi:hypothetical protein
MTIILAETRLVCDQWMCLKVVGYCLSFIFTVKRFPASLVTRKIAHDASCKSVYPISQFVQYNAARWQGSVILRIFILVGQTGSVFSGTSKFVKVVYRSNFIICGYFLLKESSRKRQNRSSAVCDRNSEILQLCLYNAVKTIILKIWQDEIKSVERWSKWDGICRTSFSSWISYRPLRIYAISIYLFSHFSGGISLFRF